MAYDYIGIINEALKSLNEVEITETDFDNLVGFPAHVKDKVNSSIMDIWNFEDTEWPFANTEISMTVTVGFTGAVDGTIPEYTIDSSLASVDWDSFYVARDDNLNNGKQQEIIQLSWDNYRSTRRDDDANSETSDHSKPAYVIRKQSNSFILSPLSEEGYTIKYEGFLKPTYLSESTDVPMIPELYRQVLVDRVLYYCYLFRENIEESDRLDAKFEKNVRDMRRILIPQSDTLRYVD